MACACADRLLLHDANAAVRPRPHAQPLPPPLHLRAVPAGAAPAHRRQLGARAAKLEPQAGVREAKAGARAGGGPLVRRAPAAAAPWQQRAKPGGPRTAAAAAPAAAPAAAAAAAGRCLTPGRHEGAPAGGVEHHWPTTAAGEAAAAAAAQARRQLRVRGPGLHQLRLDAQPPGLNRAGRPPPPPPPDARLLPLLQHAVRAAADDASAVGVAAGRA